MRFRLSLPEPVLCPPRSGLDRARPFGALCRFAEV